MNVANTNKRLRVNQLSTSNTMERNASNEWVNGWIDPSSYRGRTGLPLNPNHTVPYRNHPFDKDNAHRRILSEDKEYIKNLYKPIRIRYFTENMEKQRTTSNSKPMDFVEDTIMPLVATFWSGALSVIPTNRPLLLDTYDLDGERYCGFSKLNAIVPQIHTTEGITDADVVWYITASDNPEFCGPSTLAVAMPCNFDQFDRPTGGVINFCLGAIDNIIQGDNISEADIQNTAFIAIHEAGHILGLNSMALPYFYNSDTGRPRTKRPFHYTKVTCVTGERKDVIMPNEDTLKMDTQDDGQLYAMVTTPKVLTVVRNHFNCQGLKGARLENQPTNLQSCFGDHWEERYFYPELMTSMMSLTTSVLSPLSLALLEDSGWYIANYSHSDIIPWGHGVGCDFVNKPCLHESTSDKKKTVLPAHSKGFFCKEKSFGCSSTLSHKMGCTIIDYSINDYQSEAPPPHSQYFSSYPYVGGPATVDYCPVYSSTINGKNYDELHCENSINQQALNTYNEFSEYYGSESKCFETNTGLGRCYLSQCIRNPPSLQFNIKGQWFNCEYDFQEITFRNTPGSSKMKYSIVKCPRLSSACPDLFCPVNCAGRGICDFDNVVNNIIYPICKCFDTSDTSPGCTESYTPKAYLRDETMLISVDTFFEDWISDINMSSPFTWTVICGSGLLGLCIIICFYSAFCYKRKKTSGNIGSNRKKKRKKSRNRNATTNDSISSASNNNRNATTSDISSSASSSSASNT